MARVTVEDCVLKVPNRFELVLLAAQRAREISSGVPLSIDRDDDKNPVVALREIADETVGLPHLKESLVRGMQKQVELDEPDEPAEIDVDPSMFAVASAGAALFDDDGDADVSETEDIDDEDEIQDEEDEATALGQELAGDEGSVAEELTEDDLAIEEDLGEAGDLAEADDLAGADDLAALDGETADIPGSEPPADDEEL